MSMEETDVKHKNYKLNDDTTLPKNIGHFVLINIIFNERAPTRNNNKFLWYIPFVPPLLSSMSI